MNQIDLTIPKDAIFSPNRDYRYALWRIWSPNRPLLLFIGINPSIANELESDPTITRNMTRASRNGFGGLLVANLFGLVSTDRKLLLKVTDPVGELNDYYIQQMVKLSSVQLCAWGSFKGVKPRADIVYQLLNNPVSLLVNQDGEPGHPLYVSYDKEMRRYERN